MYSSSPSPSPYLWYRQPGTSFYILANNNNNSMVSWPRAYYQPSYNYYNQNRYQINYPDAGVTIEEVEEVEEEEEENHGDEELNDDIVDVGNEEFSAMSTIDELKSYEEEEAIANGDVDAPLYSPISMCSSLSDATNELIARNLDQLNDDEFDGDIDPDSDESPEVTVLFKPRISEDLVHQHQVAVESAMEDEGRVDLQLKVNEDEREPDLMDVGGANNVQTIQVEPAIRKSSRLLKKSKDEHKDAADESPKKKVMKWMTRQRCHCCTDPSKRH